MCQSKPASSSRRLYTEGNLTLLPHLTHISTSNKEPSHPGSFDQDILGTLSFKKPVIATMNPWLEVVVCPVFILLCVRWRCCLIVGSALCLLKVFCRLSLLSGMLVNDTQCQWLEWHCNKTVGGTFNLKFVVCSPIIKCKFPTIQACLPYSMTHCQAHLPLV